MMHPYSELSAKLLALLPELRDAYERELATWWVDDAPGPHVVFGDLLMPHIVELLQSGRDEVKLRKIFRFLEELATDPAKDVREVVAFSVVEGLVDDRQLLQAAWPYMGPAIRRFAKDVSSYWGMNQDFPGFESGSS
jgi:hypothetical protein